MAEFAYIVFVDNGESYEDWSESIDRVFVSLNDAREYLEYKGFTKTKDPRRWEKDVSKWDEWVETIHARIESHDIVPIGGYHQKGKEE